MKSVRCIHLGGRAAGYYGEERVEREDSALGSGIVGCTKCRREEEETLFELEVSEG